MLEINWLSIHYGSVEVVSGVTMRVDEGKIVEEGSPETFFSHPKSERTQTFLSKILVH